MVPFVLLNALGGIAAFIWLFVLREWWAIGYGVAGLFFSHYLLGLAVMPGALFGVAGKVLGEKGPFFLPLFLILLSELYTYALISAWCIFVMRLFLSHARDQTHWPLLIWSSGVALGPWRFLAQQDGDSEAGDYSAWRTFFAQVSYVVTGLVVALHGWDLRGDAMIFGGVMLVGMLLQVAWFFYNASARGRARIPDPLIGR
jgi:hypothetical protein